MAAALASAALSAKHAWIHAGTEEEEEDDDDDDEEGWEVMVRWSKFWASESMDVGLQEIQKYDLSVLFAF